jgi:hypothetical protein
MLKHYELDRILKEAGVAQSRGCSRIWLMALNVKTSVSVVGVVAEMLSTSQIKSIAPFYSVI